MRSKYTIGDIVKINPESLKKNHILETIRYLDTSSVTENRFDSPEVLKAKNAPSRAKRIVKDKDIVISTVRPNLKHFGFIDKPEDNLIVSTGFAVIRCDESIVEPRYLYSLLSLNKTTNYLATVAEGSTTTYPSIKPSVIAELEVELPPLPTQKKIAHILSTLDDKIELNRKMNQTLEAMAQALFKSWFVDFDPVRARAEAKSDAELEMKAAELGIAKEVLDLFPSRLVESEMGMIPEGWEVKPLYKTANIVYGAPFSSKQFNDEQRGKPLIRIRDLKTFTSQHWTEEVHLKGTLIKAGDLLIGMDAEFTPTIWQGIDGWLNQRVLKVEPINGTFTAFHYFALKPKMKFFEQANVGTTVIHLGKKDIDTIKIFVPSKELLKKAALIMEPLFNKIVDNSSNNRSLQKIRDTLLPKLLSGELDV